MFCQPTGGGAGRLGKEIHGPIDSGGVGLHTPPRRGWGKASLPLGGSDRIAKEEFMPSWLVGIGLVGWAAVCVHMWHLEGP